MQMWEYMGRLMLDEQLLTEMEKQGFKDETVFKTANVRDGYRMSRAEISDVAGLLGQPLFRKHARELGHKVRTALQEAGIPEVGSYATQPDLAELRRVIGLLCIDEPLLRPAHAAGTPADDIIARLAELHFSLSPKPAEVVRKVMGIDGTGIEDAHAIHLLWSPPDCFSAVSFSKKFERPNKGGVKRVIISDPKHTATQAP